MCRFTVGCLRRSTQSSSKADSVAGSNRYWFPDRTSFPLTTADALSAMALVNDSPGVHRLKMVPRFPITRICSTDSVRGESRLHGLNVSTPKGS